MSREIEGPVALDMDEEQRREAAARLGVKELKRRLGGQGVSTKGCTEKR